MDQVGHRLDQYATFLTNFSESQKSPIDMLSDDTGLPSQPLANALRKVSLTSLSIAMADPHSVCRWPPRWWDDDGGRVLAPALAADVEQPPQPVAARVHQP